MEISFFDEAQNVWKGIMRNTDPVQKGFDLKFYKKIIDLFHVGRYYYYFVDWQKMEITYISPEIESILGYPPHLVDAPFFMSLIHPDDQPVYLNHEAAVVDFLRDLPNDKVLKYKMSYDFRIKNSSGKYIRVLQQAIALQCDENNNLLLTLGVHTDITHLQKNNTSVLSYIGLEGEPSYINVKAKKIYKAANELFTEREKEIIHYLLKGEQSIEIAEKLNISKYTVDTHRKNILQKANTKTTLELAIKILTDGLL